LISFVFLGFIFFFHVKGATYAQFCGGPGSYQCCSEWKTSCIYSDGSDGSCRCGSAGCTSVQYCNNWQSGTCPNSCSPCTTGDGNHNSCTYVAPTSGGTGGGGTGGGSTGPYCGDGICNNGETQSSCSTDCGAPAPTCTTNYYNEYDQCGGSCNGTSYSASQSDHVVVYKNSCTGNLSYSCSLNATCSTGCDTSTGECATVTRTYNQCGGNCNGTTYGANVTENITEKNTNGSYTYTCNSHATCSSTCNTSTGTCTTSTRTYNQCGGNCNGTTYGASVTENITATTNPDGSSTFVCNSHSTCTNGCDTGTGQCVANTTPAPTAAPTQPPSTTAVCNQSYGTCGCSSNCKDGANTDYSCCHRAWGACTSGTQACVTVFGAGAQQCSNNTTQSCTSSPPPTTTCVNPQWQCHTWDSTRCPDGSYYHDEQCGTSAPYSYYQFCDGQCPVNTAPPPTSAPTASPPPVYTDKCAGVTCSGCQTCFPSSGTCQDNDLKCGGTDVCQGGVCVSGGPTPVAITDRIFKDNNNNGVYDSGEGVSGMTAHIAGWFGATDSTGSYRRTGFTSGNSYTVSFSSPIPAGYTLSATTPNPRTVKPGNTDYEADFILVPPAPSQSTITGILYQNGGVCTGGTPLAGATVRLVDSSGNPVGTPVTTDSTGKYTFTATNANNYSLEFTNTLGSSLQYAHTSSCTSKTGNTYTFNLTGNQTIDFYFNNFAPWFQTDLGDVRIGYLLNKIPGGTTASTSTTNPSIFYSTNSDPEFGSGQASSKGWAVGSEYDYNSSSSSRNGSSAYTFYESRAAETGVSIKSISDLSQITGSGVYELSAGAINNPYTVPNGQHIVILAPADLTINAPMTVPSGTKSLLIVAAKGNLTIGAGVGTTATDPNTFSLQGIYTSEKNIVLAGTGCSAGNNPDKRLNVGGVLIANSLRPFDSNGGGKIQNQRSLCTTSSGNGQYPSLFVSTRLDFITQLTQFYKTTYQKWEEVQP